MEAGMSEHLSRRSSSSSSTTAAVPDGGPASLDLPGLPVRVDFLLLCEAPATSEEEAVLRSLPKWTAEELLERLRQVPQGADASSNMRRLVLEFVRFGLSHPTHYQLLMMPRGENNAPQPSSSIEVVALLRQPVAQLAGAQRLLPRDPEAAGQACHCQLRGKLDAGLDPPADLGPRNPKQAEGRDRPSRRCSNCDQRSVGQRPARHK